MTEQTSAQLRAGLASYTTVLGITRPAADQSVAAPSQLAISEQLACACQRLWLQQRISGDQERLAVRETIVARHVRSTPLLDEIDRLHALHDVTVLLPRLTQAFVTATLRTVPDDLTQLPLTEQWCGMLRRHTAHAALPTVAAPVHTEYERLLHAAQADVLRTTLTATTATGFLRAAAALVPPYLRLAALESRTTLTDAPVTADAELPGTDDTLALGETAATAASSDEEEREDPRTPSADQAQASESHRLPERTVADLHATPDSVTRGQHEGTAEDSAARDADAWSAEPTDSASVACEAATLAEYRSRLARVHRHVADMRAVWRRVLAEGFGTHWVLTHRASAEGGQLNTLHLAQSIAEVHAGVARPHAFYARAQRRTVRTEVGSTDYVLVLDRSASMRGKSAQITGEAAMIMLEALAGVMRDINRMHAHGAHTIGSIRAALIVFGSEATVVKRLSGTLHELERVQLFSRLQAVSGSTNGGAALAAARAELSAPQPRQVGRDARARKIVIYVSDGECDDRPRLVRELARLRAMTVEVFGIAIGARSQLPEFQPTLTTIAGAHELPAALHQIIARSTLTEPASFLAATPTQPNIAR